MKRQPYYGPLNEAATQMREGNLVGAWLYLQIHTQQNGHSHASRALGKQIQEKLDAAPRVEYARL